jgi:hypothetical protein
MEKSIKEGWNCALHNKDISINYKSACLDAFGDDVSFNKFKSNPNYYAVVGCDSHGKPTCNMFYDWVISNHPDLIKYFDKFRENDSVGGPPTFVCGEDGEFSPNTMRYTKALGDLQKYFGDLTDADIVEIGSGFGGQAKIISCVYDIKSYTMIDCFEAIKLVEKCMSKYDLAFDQHYYDIDNIKIKDYHLGISDSAISEMNDDSFDFYLEDVLSKTKYTYCTMNDVYRKDISISKFKNVFSSVEVIPDRPSMNQQNECYILICEK